MITFDASQERVLALDTGRHARVVGAAGSGKTLLVLETVRRVLLAQSREVLVLTQQRQSATRLREQVEAHVSVPLTGTLVRTAGSLAFALVSLHRKRAGLPPVQLLSAAKQDEMIHGVFERLTQAQPSSEATVSLPWSTEHLESERFRTELRDVWRVIDEFDIEPESLHAAAEQLHLALGSGENGRHTRAALTHVREAWVALVPVFTELRQRPQPQEHHELTSSEVMREATRLLGDPEAQLTASDLPQLVLVDQAEDLTEGTLALLAVFAERGTAIWVFGDPDTSTGVYQGAPVPVLSRLHDELRRRAPGRSKLLRIEQSEQSVTLEQVYRHGVPLRTLVQRMSERIGVSSEWRQRSATAARGADTRVEFTRATSLSEMVGVIAHRFRSRHLGLGGHDPVDWSQMAVICRSTDESRLLASMLEQYAVPTRTTTGGIVIREHQLTRDMLRVLRWALDPNELSFTEIRELMLGPLCGFDALSLRRLDKAVMLSERKQALSEARDAETIESRLRVMLAAPDTVLDTAEGRRLRTFARLLSSAAETAAEGGTPREVLWQLWQSTGHERLQTVALHDTGIAGSLAHRDLDAVMALFFALQRHEERASVTPVTELIDELATSSVPQDTLAARSVRPAVTVTTPQGAAAHEYRVVCITGPQEGAWPNTRPRGSMFGTSTLEHLLRSGQLFVPNRTSTLHDELRLLVSACSRASDELLVVAREDEETFPSGFWFFGAEHAVTGLPSAMLTMGGHIAALRRRLLRDPDDIEAARNLALLAARGIDGADPDTWYGVRTLSTLAPLVDLADDPDATVRVSPSAIETAETCPLNWVANMLGGHVQSAAASVGTVLHHIMQHEPGGDVDRMLDMLEREWPHVPFDAQWEREREHAATTAMVHGLADYLRQFQHSGQVLLGTEARFTLTLGRATLRGSADRIELRTGDDNLEAPVIIDLKTGSTAPSLSALTGHAQLLAYQLGLTMGQFVLSGTQTDDHTTFERSGGASLLYVAEGVPLKGHTYREYLQAPLSDETREQFIERVQQVAHTMAASSFLAQVDHHCQDTRYRTDCQLHIIPAVSYE